MTTFTTNPRTDGFGAQFQNIIVDILYTKIHTNNTYVFPDIKSFGHNYDKDPLFTQKLIDYMNLKPHFPNTNNIANPSCYDDRTYSFCENNLSYILQSTAFKELQNMFFENKQTPFDTNFFNVAVHIRRHNQEDIRIAGTDTPDHYYLNLIQHFRRNYKGQKPLKFHIYSQGPSSNYSMYVSNDTEFHLNEFVLDTFNGLVFADGLIASSSSFSYIAAILNKGIIYYKQFWHKPANHWVIGDNIPVQSK
jgi:hypothetical protein